MENTDHLHHHDEPENDALEATEAHELTDTPLSTMPVNMDAVEEKSAFLTYATSVGGPAIKVEDKGRIKGNAMMAMYEQTDRQMDQLKNQMETLVQQAQMLKRRKEISEQIYQAALAFRPVVGHVYHLYVKDNGTSTISLIAPEEWGRKCPYTYIATCQLLYDHTWEILHEADISVTDIHIHQ